VFADTSDVTLTTGDPRAELSDTHQQGAGQPPRQKTHKLFNGLRKGTVELRGLMAIPFSARRQDLPLWIGSKSGIG
jgi:hypothetical protein